jgi:hypothetical protein
MDVYSFSKGANIFTNVAVTDVTNYISYPSATGSDTLYFRESGSMTNIFKLTIFGGTAPTFIPNRVYTFVYRGSYRGTRVLNLYANR